MAGYSDKKMDGFGDLSVMTPQEIQELVRKKSMESLGLNGNGRQKIVAMEEVKSWIEQGWEYLQKLPSDDAVIGLPRL